ncbi:hypothetical protein E2562_018824 [Oryza meyeriana var. granulata]|uniref:Uncharacterized protein n=1 Tax=Oryza meyeriana var. granulata TaxID=110450 RepID=A0A6G1F9K8_9ORYZ|nr:hypothetical protein E2562_018824 [Oryza meyeriana var. granulata]
MSEDRRWMSWKQVPFNKKDRMPNTILGVLLRHHYPQKVNDKTKRPPVVVPATKWQHWYMVGQPGDTMADRVKNDFMARYKWPDNEPELQHNFEKTLEKCCNNLAKQQVPHNLHAAAIQKTGDSSHGYPQAAHNFGENGSSTSPAGRTSSTENANTAENEYEPTIGRPTATENVNAVENGYVPTVGGINAEESSGVADANDPFLAQMLG